MKITRLFALAILALCTAGSQAWAQTTNIISDDFTGSSTNLPWTHLGNACLTAGSPPPYATPSTTIPACTSIVDTAGSGALRLTDAVNHQNGAIFSVNPFPSDQGLQVTFTAYAYGGNGADGIGFYLLDGTKPAPTSIGAVGGSLGYSCTNDPTNVNASQTGGWEGMPNAYLGLGIDEYGNYGNPSDNTNSGPGFISNRVSMRGAGNMTYSTLHALYPDDYPANLPLYSTSTARTQQNAINKTCKTNTIWDFSDGSPSNTGVALQSNLDYGYIAGSPILNASGQPLKIAQTNVSQRSNATPINYRLIITTSGLLSLAYSVKGNPYQSIIQNKPITTDNGPLPPYLRFGFGASTGGLNDVHEITCFEASPAVRAISAPVTPLSISSSSLIYTLNSNPNPIQGFVQAFPVSSTGVPSSTPSWDAGQLMSVSGNNRPTVLYSTDASGMAPTLLTSVDGAAFSLTSPSTCVPDTNTIVQYTIDPNYLGNGSACSYLAGRAPNWLLGAFSSGDFASILAPPGNPLDLGLSGYTAFAASQSKRPSALLFTNNDGFLYSVNAATGALNWGWMPRPFLAQLQNYSVVPTEGLFDGKFRVVDAVDAAGNWGTYIVGSARSVTVSSNGVTVGQGGSYWYDLKLGNPSNGSTPMPAAVIQAPAVPPGATYPQRQAPVVANINGSQIAAFIVNVGSGTSAYSSLYEFNVATGASTSAAIPSKSISGVVSSNLFLDAASGQLYFGDSSGNVYAMSFTGQATTDIGNIGNLGSTRDGLAVNFINYQYSNNLPYLLAASAKGLTTFGIGASGFGPLWATDGSGGYQYNKGSWSTSNSVAPLQLGATVSDAPALVAGIVDVPVYVPPSSSNTCNVAGKGYYDFFSLASGTFPKNQIKDVLGNFILADVYIGAGAAYSPSMSISGSGLPVFGGTQQTATPGAPLVFNKHGIDAVVQWRVH